MKNNNIYWLCIFFIPLFSFAQAQRASVPVLQQRVTDLTGSLTQSERYTLESILTQYEDTTAIQIVVLLTPTIGKYDLVQYAQSVAEQNKIGIKKNNCGVLLLFVMQDRLIRIHVGRGLEDVLTNELCKTIIEREIKPRFQRKDFYLGIFSAVQRIEEAAGGEPRVEKTSKQSGQHSKWIFFPIVVVAGIFLLIRMARGTGCWIGGGGYQDYSTGFGGYWGSGYSGWGFGGGGFGGGGSFSGGGGGSFGGGGASGSW
ncbi:MAG: TPM domain-containing protein [Bacteroidota bacterium]